MRMCETKLAAHLSQSSKVQTYINFCDSGKRKSTNNEHVNKDISHATAQRRSTHKRKGFKMVYRLCICISIHIREIQKLQSCQEPRRILEYGVIQSTLNFRKHFNMSST